MKKNKHFRNRLLVLFFSAALSMNGFVLYAKNAEAPDDAAEPAASTELLESTVKETEEPRTEEQSSEAETSVVLQKTSESVKETKPAGKTAEKTTAAISRTAGTPSPYAEEDNNIAKIIRGEEEVFYTDFATALRKVLAGEEIILLKDIPAKVGYYTIDKSITLNLNGHSIDGLKNYTILINKYNTAGITVTIKDGTVYSSCDRDYDAMGICMPLYVRSCGNVILDNVKLEARPVTDISSTGMRIEKNATLTNGSVPQVTVSGKNTLIKGGTAGINIISNMKDNRRPELVINGGLIEGGSFGIAGNGTNDATDTTVNGGTVRAMGNDGTAIYHPQDGDLTVSGGIIEGVNGIQFCGAGSLSVTGGMITAAADSISPGDPSDGSILDGAALSVVSRGGEYGAAKSLDVSITGGILKSLHHTAIREYSTNNQETLINQIQIYQGENKDLRVISGAQKEAVIFDTLSGNDAMAVSGGRFSSILSDAYCAVHFECQKEKDKENLYSVVPRTYSLTYDYAGGKLPEGRKNPSGYTYFDSAFTLVNPQKEGYDFVGWTGNGISIPQKEVTIAVHSEGKKTYTAVYSPKESRIVFKTETDDITIPDKVGKTDEVIRDRTMPKVTAPKGYGFAGWFDQKGRKAALLPEKFPAGTTVYTARWNLTPLASDPNIQIEVPELSPDGTGVTVSDTSVTESARQAKTIMNEIAAGKVPAGMSAEDARRIKDLLDSAEKDDSVITVLSLQAERKEQAAKDEQNKFASVMRADEQAAAYFDLSVAVSVRVESPDGTVRRVENINLSTLETPLLFELHVDPSWIREKAVRIAHVHNGKAEILTAENVNRKNGSIELYAQSFSTYAVLTSENVEITFDSQGGTKISPQTVKYGTVITKPKDPVKKGSAFIDWCLDKDGKEVYDFKTKVQDSFTLYAKWSKKEKTRTADSGHQNTGAGSHSKPVKAGDTADLRLWPSVLLASAACILILKKKLK
ncbi:InlB B-repeat-containing protein [Anaerostipes sp.]|uniref:InlB B-repeat-containing protein n=1 Tax=Anaerostipes sp. TaxID=1872530 RepID=UPI0025C1B88A|nr:InlB B-repeat-containing protein [Anaerostipes sp.]MBS7009366.1 InlB B-repeat-containing protein [Anaerostipes sp.]